ncbi:hypothetical protein SPSIL_044200 [Sporomusa silvacetica DSM 10669]|uniref:Uncharacterized protein n=1 Tax=Sporomusa silvacetica DSM 10669 TaxID=1123289 RepID=A0ABZ3IR64_9FIRM|nr:hypothetical protein SPSIL_15490 [Sporomusa silvacetica DSM 10669]
MAAQQMVTIGQGSNNAVINVPLKSIDLAKWFFSLKDEEYRACSSGHNGMVQGRLPSGKRVAVSVETIGGNFIVNNFIEDLVQRDHVRTVSSSVMWIGGPDGTFSVLVKVTWELKIAAVSAQSCMLTCNVTAETADMTFLATLQNLPPSDSDSTQEHFIGETPFFAADIEKKARLGIVN